MKQISVKIRFPLKSDENAYFYLKERALIRCGNWYTNKYAGGKYNKIFSLNFKAAVYFK